MPISFICCWHDEDILRQNLASTLPVTREDEVILIHGATSISSGYAEGEQKAKHDILVFLHSDMRLPPNWRNSVMDQVAMIEQRDARWGIIGLFGARWDIDGTRLVGIQTYGHAVDCGATWNHGVEDLPCQVDVVDSIMMMKRKGAPSFDPHVPTFQGVSEDICLSSRALGMSVWVIDAFAEHVSCQGISPTYDNDLQQAAAYLVGKWGQHIPSTTKLWEHSLAILGGVSLNEMCSRLDGQLDEVL